MNKQKDNSAKKGKWIKRQHLFHDAYVCPFCKSSFSRKSDRCPVCGARLTGAKADPVWVYEMEDELD